jgi:hypothetical protein
MEEIKAPLMATLLAVARAIQGRARQHPKEAAPYFMAAYNAVLDVTPPTAVWEWQIVKLEERFDQHKLDCKSCKPHPNALDCPTATRLKFRLEVCRARLVEAEAKTWAENRQASQAERKP